MTWWRQYTRLLRLELRLVLGSARWLGTLVVVACVPVLYLLIYLSSMWDPGSHTRALRVGVVNLDKGYAYRDESVNIGNELVTKLLHKGDFGYFPIQTPEQARERVRAGDLAFAVLIPPDFSATALPAQAADEGRLEVYASAGNNYQIYLIAKKFAEEIDAELNQALTQQRWRFVLTSKVANNDLFELRSALGQMQKGAQDLNMGLQEAAKAGSRLHQGAGQLSDEVARLSNGSQQMGQALKGLESALPPAEDVRRLRVGADDLAQGHQDMDRALAGLHAGSVKLVQGVEQFRTTQSGVPFFSANLQEALDPLQNNLIDLRDGLYKTQQGHRQLASGSEVVRDGVRNLAFGVRDMRAGLRQMVTKVPDSAQFNQLTQGAQDLAQSQGQLEQGLNKLRDGSVYLLSSVRWVMERLPTQIRLIDGSPEGLAHSVATELKVHSPVSHLGAAMVPSVIPVAIWLGAGIAIFLIRGRHVALFARRYSGAAKLLAKAGVPIMVVGLQTFLMLVLLLGWLGLQVLNLSALIALMFGAAVSFVFVVLLFIRVAGDAGKALAMLLLALQISASGGVVPIELSGEFFSALSPLLPMTWLVQGLKAAMFGAYGGDWWHPLQLTLLLGGVSALLAIFLGRWHHVRASRLRPALDV